nr:MAG TPA: hypothetical protein [Bacteriophage sp.]
MLYIFILLSLAARLSSGGYLFYSQDVEAQCAGVMKVVREIDAQSVEPPLNFVPVDLCQDVRPLGIAFSKPRFYYLVASVLALADRGRLCQEALTVSHPFAHLVAVLISVLSNSKFLLSVGHFLVLRVFVFPYLVSLLYTIFYILSTLFYK